MTSDTTTARSWRPWIGLGLILYGLAGLILAGAGGMLVSASFRGVDRIADTIVAQRNVLVLSLDTTATFIGNAASGTTAVDDVLGDAVEATREAATMTGSLATAADTVAQAATFQILGQQPFAGVASSFTQVAADARALATSLQGAAETIGSTTEDIEKLRTDLRTVADQVRQFSRGLSGTVVLDDLEQGFDPPRIVLYGLLVWLGVQAAAAVVAGIALIIGARRRRVIVVEEELVLPF